MGIGLILIQPQAVFLQVDTSSQRTLLMFSVGRKVYLELCLALILQEPRKKLPLRPLS